MKYCPICGETNNIQISNGVEYCSICSNEKTPDQFQLVYNSLEDYNDWIENNKINNE